LKREKHKLRISINFPAEVTDMHPLHSNTKTVGKGKAHPERKKTQKFT